VVCQKDGSFVQGQQREYVSVQAKVTQPVIPQSVDMLIRQLGSSFWQVVQEAIRCLGQIYPYVLSALYVFLLYNGAYLGTRASTTFVSAAHSNLWNQMSEVKDKMLAIINPNSNKSVILQALKFIQVIVLVQSMPNSSGV
jgi:hypothetical protein